MKLLESVALVDFRGVNYTDNPNLSIFGDLHMLHSLALRLTLILLLLPLQLQAEEVDTPNGQFIIFEGLVTSIDRTNKRIAISGNHYIFNPSMEVLSVHGRTKPLSFVKPGMKFRVLLKRTGWSSEEAKKITPFIRGEVYKLKNLLASRHVSSEFEHSPKTSDMIPKDYATKLEQF